MKNDISSKREKETELGYERRIADCKRDEMKTNLDCPICSVFMNPVGPKNKPNYFICPICQSLFSPNKGKLKEEKECHCDGKFHRQDCPKRIK